MFDDKVDLGRGRRGVRRDCRRRAARGRRGGRRGGGSRPSTGRDPRDKARDFGPDGEGAGGRVDCLAPLSDPQEDGGGASGERDARGSAERNGGDLSSH